MSDTGAPDVYAVAAAARDAVAARDAAAARDATAAGPDALVACRLDGLTPDTVVHPATAEALAAALREADENGRAVVLRGGGTSIDIGAAPERYNVAIDTRRLDQVLDYVPDDLTVTVQGGVGFGRLQAMLAESGQFVPFDVPRAENATAGGALAAARSGPRRATYGTGRDWLIGCAVVLADGTLIHAGGRVVKNVSGYDLCKLFAGSFGSLGCIVEATFKLRPLPHADATLGPARLRFRRRPATS